MGKKKRGHPDVEDVLSRPWCYYCERDFEDLKLLISHQKAKHFKCDRCGRRLNTAGGLSVHLNQVHKENLEHVENALPNRQGLDVEIFGMEGIPQETLDQHRNRILQNFYQAQEDRRIATGNPIPGQGKPPRKKVKMEDMDEMKARLKAHRAKVAERKAAIARGELPADAPLVPPAASPGAFNNSPFPAPQGQQAGAAPADQPQFPQQQGFDYNPSSGLPAPPGLPQRTLPYGQGVQPPPAQAEGAAGAASADAIDLLIRNAEMGIRPENEAAAATATGGEKKAKKGARMVYSDETVSPEERMAMLPRYAYVPPVS